jgi:tRNA G18 (ribose-2'-O)-methylase SpoU
LTTVIVCPAFTVIRFGENEKSLMSTASAVGADPVALPFPDHASVTSTAIRATTGTIATTAHVGTRRNAVVSTRLSPT